MASWGGSSLRPRTRFGPFWAPPRPQSTPYGSTHCLGSGPGPSKFRCHIIRLGRRPRTESPVTRRIAHLNKIYRHSYGCYRETASTKCTRLTLCRQHSRALCLTMHGPSTAMRQPHCHLSRELTAAHCSKHATRLSRTASNTDRASIQRRLVWRSPSDYHTPTPLRRTPDRSL